LRGAEEPTPPIIFQAMLSHFDFRVAKQWERVGVGKGLSQREAMLGAVGEAVEHYCASHFDGQRTVSAPWAAVANGAVAPTELVLYSENQYQSRDFPYQRWSPEQSVRWLKMTELPENREVYLPATLVYLTLGDAPITDFFCPPTSNGLAAGPNLHTAILHGLLELIERDAFLISWMNRLPAARLEVSCQGTERFILEHYREFGIEVKLFDISTDLLPYVVMALGLDKSGNGPAVVIGLGCHPSPTIAARKALFELCQAHPGEVRRFREEQPSAKLKGYSDVRTLEEHSAFFHPVARLDEVSFLLKNEHIVPLEQLPDRSTGEVSSDLRNCVNSLTAVGSRVFFADLTTCDVRPYGLCVVRTLATGLQPMHFGFGEERLGGLRLFTLPQKLGHCSGIRLPEDLNPAPHPLA
jgi:ribosomal protein S12 methylthiotransferase accessory factor